MSLTKVSYSMIQGAPVSALDFGAVGDGVTDNTLAIAAMMAFVNNQKTNVEIVFPAGVYVYSPNLHYSSANAWRFAVELVDVSYVTLSGYGATLKQVIPSGWIVGDPANYGNDEGAIQFRSIGDSTCHNIVVKGITCEMTKLTYSAGTGDGASFGIAMRGVKNYVVSDCNVTNASTDGIYCGPTYSDTYGGSYGKISNCFVNLSNRNGLSIVQNSFVQIVGGSYTNSTGGSFQAGIDLEPNASGTQSNISISDVYVGGNALRGIAAIRTSYATIENCTFDKNTKDVTIEGSASFINVVDNTFKCNAIGIDTSGTNVTNIKIQDNNFYAPDAITYFIRMNFFGGSGHANYTIQDNSLNGQSGIYVGTITGYCDVVGNMHFANIPSGGSTGSNAFTWASISPVLRLKNNTIIIDSTITWSGTQVKFAVANGWAEGNKFISHSGAVGYMNSRTPAYPIEYGQNEWSQYFYYQELNATGFTIKGKGTGIAFQGDGGPAAGGTYGARVVIGGYARTTNINATDNQVGDVTYFFSDTSGNPIAYRCTVAGVAGSSAGTWVGLWNKT